MDASPAELAERVVATLETLADLGEAVEDERQYVRDLVLVWTARLRVVGSAAASAAVSAAGSSPGSADRPIPDGAADAIERLCDEAARISDPHRAIDWLSTLPQAAIVALGDVP